MRRLALALAALATLVAMPACAGSGTHEIAAFPAEPPYIPPPPLPGRQQSDADIAAAQPQPASRAPAISGAPSDAQVARDLQAAFGGKSGKSARALTNSAGLDRHGLATVPPGAPATVAAIINAGNSVATRPYRYGGGHGGGPEGIFVDNAYDCSGSVSYALASAGFVDSPMDSTALSRFGKSGPGRWVTIFANGGHAWMIVAGLRFDTSGRQEGGSRWQTASRSTAGFTVRHPVGL